jgi:monofunctional biosynthetic peptidoglycan transglycosylase
MSILRQRHFMALMKSRFRFINFIVRWFVYLFLSSFVYLFLCKWMMPPITLTQISALVQGDGLERSYVSWKDISPNVKLAAMASEDQLFPDHEGFDWKAIEKSMQDKPISKRKKIRPKGAAASTISQQTAKNVFLWQGSGLTRYLRKAPEFVYTFLIEMIWGKKRIMEVYLNVIEMGAGIYGIEAAAQHYFHKSAKSLSRQEAAMIVACLPNPKLFTVVPESRRVQWRTPRILFQMQMIQSDPDIQDLIH